MAPGGYISLVMVNPADTGGHHLIQVYICDYCFAFVPEQHERIHDEYHRRRYDRPIAQRPSGRT